MTEHAKHQTLPESSIVAPKAMEPLPEDSALNAPAAPPGEDLLARLERMQRESRERAAAIDAAFQSPEAQAIRKMIQDDGNVDWTEFVKSCDGGILAVVEMVDEQGRPDAKRIIPLVDALFEKHFGETEMQGGVIFRRHPRNRPYRPGPGVNVAVPLMPGDKGFPEPRPAAPSWPTRR